MGLLASITSWFKKESAEVKGAVSDLEGRLDTDLSQMERELDATPAERLDMIQQDIDADTSLDAIRDRIESSAAKADAIEELNTPPDSNSSDPNS